MNRWVEHCSELYAVENLPTIDEMDFKPTVEEVGETLDALSSGKAPGVLKCGKGTLANEFHELLCQCWGEGTVSQDMGNANIITLYKSKCDRNDCSIYRGISLLGFARSSWPGSRSLPKESTLSQSSRKVQGAEKGVACIGLAKAFDLVRRDGLLTILAKTGSPPIMLNLIRSFHKDMKGTITFDTQHLSYSASGVAASCSSTPLQQLQRACSCVRGPTEMSSTYPDSEPRQKYKSRDEAPGRFHATQQSPYTAEDLQQLLNHFATACNAFSLTISLKKMQMMGQDVDEPLTTKIADYELRGIHEFVYQASTITDHLSLESDLNRRIGNAATILSRTNKRVWTNNTLAEHTKTQTYMAGVVSTLLYGWEAWTLRPKEGSRLSAFHMRCLTRFLREIMTPKAQRLRVPTMPALMKKRRLHWLGLAFSNCIEQKRPVIISKNQGRGHSALSVGWVNNSSLHSRSPSQAWTCLSGLSSVPNKQCHSSGDTRPPHIIILAAASGCEGEPPSGRTCRGKCFSPAGRCYRAEASRSTLVTCNMYLFFDLVMSSDSDS
ncbi:uncharacterized protein LOC119596231 [Penaeus monodon]|uniref:uncharacterized protein LOC119596231 n=1 Tax=Penaeus monodon TaxID=6687 RepID=UPI0018A770FB|nr:uncharacterized protein LOC119596231 [Penaeus monodon]